MKIIGLLLILSLFFSLVFADELTFPFQCYPKILQKEFKRNKLKLDLDSSNRTDKSWGYLKNEGAKYIIYTYKTVTQEELTITLKIARKIEREKNKNVKKHGK